MPRTPIGGIGYAVAPATGADDIGLLEERSELLAAVRLASRRARTPAGEPLDGERLPIGDLDAIVVELRRRELGDRIVAEGTCTACGSAIDIAFALSELEAHRRPRRPRNVEQVAGSDRWAVAGTGVEFRVPRAGDVLAAAGEPDPERALWERCAQAAGDTSGAGARAAPRPSARARARAERALAALAPALATEVAGECPECAATVELWVDPRALCLSDLRFLAASVIDDTHVIASTYHWSELEIMAMTSSRRKAYADCIRGAREAPLPAEVFGG